MVCICEQGSSLGDAREMVKEEVNCIGGKCPKGKKNCNCLPPIAHKMDNRPATSTVLGNASLESVSVRVTMVVHVPVER